MDTMDEIYDEPLDKPTSIYETTNPLEDAEGYDTVNYDVVGYDSIPGSQNHYTELQTQQQQQPATDEPGDDVPELPEPQYDAPELPPPRPHEYLELVNNNDVTHIWFNSFNFIV